MQFSLFSKISFEVLHPIALIESYCFQSDFYSNYDLIENKKIEDVNKIGARIKVDSLIKCKSVINESNKLNIFKHDLDSLLSLSEKNRNNCVEELCEKVVKKLMEMGGVGLSKSTKILHTLYPALIPMIDNPLQDLYRKEINVLWPEKRPEQIFVEYYKNLLMDENRQNLNQISNIISKQNIINLTKIRIFDILWWSYLKAKKLREEKKINWSTIQ